MVPSLGFILSSVQSENGWSVVCGTIILVSMCFQSSHIVAHRVQGRLNDLIQRVRKEIMARKCWGGVEGIRVE